jgi:hypothetical protein
VDWYMSDYSRRKHSTLGSSSPAVWLQFVGLIPAYDLQRMSEAIRDCERVDSNEW